MDLDELKKSWKQVSEQEIALQQPAFEQWKNKHSKSPLVSLRKSMIVELVVLYVFIAFIALFYQGEQFNHSKFVTYALVAFIIVVEVFQLIFAYRIYKNSKKTFFTASVKEQLHQNIQALKKDVRFYKLYNFAMYLPAMFTAFLMVNKAIHSFESFTYLSGKDTLIGLSTVILLAYPYYLFVNWWIAKFYNKYIEQLEEAYNEIVLGE